MIIKNFKNKINKQCLNEYKDTDFENDTDYRLVFAKKKKGKKKTKNVTLVQIGAYIPNKRILDIELVNYFHYLRQ